MISSAVSYKVFGMSMQSRSERRKLVVVTYILLAIVCAATTWIARTSPGLVAYALYAAVAVGIFVFGGQGRYGLIKPFLNRPPRSEPPMVELVRLQLNPLSVGTPDPSSWKNDEREIGRRDAAHYLAYQPLAVAFLAILMLASYAIHPPSWFPLEAILSLIFVIALVACVLAITLPSAIILWTEPDIDLS